MRRRAFLSQSIALAAPVAARADEPRTVRTFPKSGAAVPAVGMGTWLTFHVDVRDAEAMARRAAVLERFFAGGGTLIDSSPMYAGAEEVLGELLPATLARVGGRRLFCATKVWTPLVPTARRRCSVRSPTGSSRAPT